MKALALLALASLLPLSPAAAAEPLPRSQAGLSVRHEVDLAIDKGLAFLKARQIANGSFANAANGAAAAEHPSLTALPLLAFQRHPAGKFTGKPEGEFLQAAYAYLRKHVQPDGGIYTKGLSNYNTAVCLMALLGTGNPADEPLLAKARAFIVAQQASGMAKPGLDGGIGYGPTGVSPKRQHPDLDNTLLSLEALRAYASARPAVEIPANKDLNWQAAIDFISRCQNLPESNGMPWASGDPANRGGFVYYPGFSNAGEQPLPDGKVALRSYGTMTYAGLLSFVYADLPKSDPRVVAATDWLQTHYTLEENPGMGRQGLYYYYHLQAKALAAAGLDQLKTADGRTVDWPRDLALKLINLQKPDGSWVNDTPRWMESDPVLVTSYCVLALEIIHDRL